MYNKKPYQKRQQGSNPLGSQTIFSNVYDAPFNPQKTTKYYAVIKQGDNSFITEYEARFRSEAVVVFNEEARLSGGHVEVVSVYK